MKGILEPRASNSKLYFNEFNFKWCIANVIKMQIYKNKRIHAFARTKKLRFETNKK